MTKNSKRVFIALSVERFLLYLVYAIVFYIGAVQALYIMPMYLEFTWLPAQILYVIIGGGVCMALFDYAARFITFCSKGISFIAMQEEEVSIGILVRKMLSKFVSLTVFVAIYNWIIKNVYALIDKVKEGTQGFELPIKLSQTFISVAKSILYETVSYLDECVEFEIASGVSNLLDSCAIAVTTYVKNSPKFIKLGFQKALVKRSLDVFIFITAIAILFYRMSLASVVYVLVGAKLVSFLIDECIIDTLFLIRFIDLYKSVRESKLFNRAGVDDVLVDGDTSKAAEQSVSFPEGIVGVEDLTKIIKRFVK